MAGLVPAIHALCHCPALPAFAEAKLRLRAGTPGIPV